MDSRFSYTEAPGSQNAAACAGFLLRAAPGVRRPGAPHRTSHDRQRLGLPQKPALRRRHEPDRRRAYIHPPLPAADQRQGRTLPPDPCCGAGPTNTPTPATNKRRQAPTSNQGPRPHHTPRFPTFLRSLTLWLPITASRGRIVNNARTEYLPPQHRTHLGTLIQTRGPFLHPPPPFKNAKIQPAAPGYAGTLPRLLHSLADLAPGRVSPAPGPDGPPG